MKTKTTKGVIITLIALLVLSVIASVVFLNYDKGVKNAFASEEKVVWKSPDTEYNGDLISRGTGTPSYTKNGGYYKITTQDGWGAGLGTKTAFTLDGATIEFFADNISTEATGYDAFGFSLGTSIYAYPTVSKFNFMIWTRIWGEKQTRTTIANYTNNGYEGQVPIAYTDKACTGSQDISGISGVKDWVSSKGTELGFSLKFDYMSDTSTWRITATVIKGAVWSENILTVYVKDSEIEGASGTGKDKKVYLGAYAYSFNTTAGYVILTPSYKIKTAGKTFTEKETGFTQIEKLNVYNDRAYYDKVVELDGLSVTTYVDNAKSMVKGDVFGFGLAKESAGFPLATANTFCATFWPKLYTDQTRLHFGYNHDYSKPSIAYAEKNVVVVNEGERKYLGSESFGFGSQYIMDYVDKTGVKLSFLHLKEYKVWEVDVQFVYGGEWKWQADKVYVPDAYMNTVLTDGKCYVVAYGFQASGSSVSINPYYKVEEGHTLTFNNGEDTSTVRAYEGQKYRLDKIEDSEKTFIGYTENGVLYSPNTEITVDKDRTLNTEFIEYELFEGASIRKTGVSSTSGIRFVASLGEDSATKYENYLINIGVIIMPTSLIEEGKEFTYENYLDKVAKMELNKSKFEFSEGELKFFASIIDIFATNFNRAFSARGYLTVNANGVETKTYTDYIKENNSRRINDVAAVALKAKEEDPNETMKKYVDKTAEISYDGKDFYYTDPIDRGAGERIIQSASGEIKGETVTLNVAVDTVKFAEIDNAFSGLSVNGVRITGVNTTYNSGVVTFKFDKSKLTEEVKEAEHTCKKHRLDIYLMAGQSNMVGYSAINSGTDDAGKPYEGLTEAQKVTYTNGRYFRSGEGKDNHPVAFDSWQSRLAPSSFGLSDNHFGPELGFSAYMNDKYPVQQGEESTLVIIKFAIGGSAMYNRWFSPTAFKKGHAEQLKVDAAGTALPDCKYDGETCGDLYFRMMTTFKQKIEMLSKDYCVHLCGLLWMQGEHDSVHQNTADLYEENLTDFIGDVRKSLNAPNLPFVMGQILEHISGTEATATVIAAQKAVAKNVKNVSLVDTSTYKQYSFFGDAHFAPQSMYQLGLSMGELVWKYHK